MVEIEGKGVDYERYALGRLFGRIAQTHHIRSVLEIPAKGEKAMPSIYSLAFGTAGCHVTLVNPEEKSKSAWKELRYPVTYAYCPDLNHTGLPAGAFELVWNFHYLARDSNRDALLSEMTRLSRKYILYVGVNRYNPGFHSHRLAHRLFRVPWTHGDVDFMSPYHISRWFERRGLRAIEAGVVDAPPFPDSLGIRDMKLHRIGTDLNTLDWDSRTIGWMKKGAVPFRIRLMYLFEMLPMPLPIKLLTSHLFYVIAAKG